jgi:hypothetical protein
LLANVGKIARTCNKVTAAAAAAAAAAGAGAVAAEWCNRCMHFEARFVALLILWMERHTPCTMQYAAASYCINSEMK